MGTSLLMLIAFPILAGALLMLEADRLFGAHVYNPSSGGRILWQHLFAHIHYVVFGTVVFAMFAGLFFWWPKMTSRMLGERAGQAALLAAVRRRRTTHNQISVGRVVGVRARASTPRSWSSTSSGSRACLISRTGGRGDRAQTNERPPAVVPALSEQPERTGRSSVESHPGRSLPSPDWDGAGRQRQVSAARIGDTKVGAVGVAQPVLRQKGGHSNVQGVRPPLPPSTTEAAESKVPTADNAWNARDADLVSTFLTPQTRWMVNGYAIKRRDAILAVLPDK